MSLPIKLLLAGESGSGKSASMASLLNEGYNVLCFNFDNNTRIVHELVPAAGERLVDVPYNVTNDVGGKNMAYVDFVGHLKTGIRVGERLVKVQSLDQSWVIVFDTLTYMSECVLRHVLGANKIVRDDAQGFNEAYWGRAQQIVHSLINYMTGPAIGAHVIFNAHTEWRQLEDGKKRYVPIVLGSALSPIIGRNFTDVWRIGIKIDGSRVVSTQTNLEMNLKCSSPLKLKAEEPLDLGKIFKRIT